MKGIQKESILDREIIFESRFTMSRDAIRKLTGRDLYFRKEKINSCLNCSRSK